MLIEFSVANYRSIKDLQRLSLTTSSSRDARENHSFVTDVKQVPHVLRAAAIYGANASGKTTLVKALAFTREFILRSARDHEPGQPIAVTPYLRDADSAGKPSHFEIVFTFRGAVYQLGFTLDRRRVTSEWLFVTPKGKKVQRWIEREYDSDTGQYNTYVNPSVPGERKTWIASTREDALLFSTAIQLNAKAFGEAHHWVQSHLRVIKRPQHFSPQVTIDRIEKLGNGAVLSFLQALGLDVDDIKIEAADPPKIEVTELFAPNLHEFATKELEKRRKVLFGHSANDGRMVYFPIEEESDGTRVLFALAGPWIDVSDNNITVVVDELHNSLHPFALRHLLDEYFTNRSKGGGQLIFTTHETYAMDEMSLHRDQIWFMNREVHGASSLTPLSDYKVRSKEPYKMGYLRGRYGGLPFFPPIMIGNFEPSDVDGEASDKEHNHI